MYIYIYVYAGPTVDPVGFEPRVLNKYTCIRCMLDQQWTHWDLNPGPSACKADVIPLHHEPKDEPAATTAVISASQYKTPAFVCLPHCTCFCVVSAKMWVQVGVPSGIIR